MVSSTLSATWTDSLSQCNAALPMYQYSKQNVEE
uniref:Uncharacterized protein n=1 Tax=Rhizophora mucronata TaxID=61149 RepID=A0A2P2NRT7_RHIMU